MYALFNLAYAHAHKVFENRHLDVIAFNEHAVVPDYLQDFIYSIIPEVHDEQRQESETRAQQKAHEAPPPATWEKWDRRA